MEGEEIMTKEEMLNYETNIYINLVRIKRYQKEINPELEFQLKTQKNKRFTKKEIVKF